MIYELCGSVKLFESANEKEILLIAIVGMNRLPAEQLVDVPLSWLANKSYSICVELVKGDNKDKTSVKKNKLGVEIDEQRARKTRRRTTPGLKTTTWRRRAWSTRIRSRKSTTCSSSRVFGK